MNCLRSMVCVLSFLLLLGCSDKARELFENAAFEESQSNMAHAKEVYQELVTNYPTSKYAEMARLRLESMKDQ